MTLPVFDPPRAPSYPVGAPLSWAHADAGGFRYRQPLPRGIHPTVQLPVIYKGATEALLHYVVDFFRAQTNGSARRFQWRLNSRMESPLSGGPAMSEVAGGALASRTYHAQYCWRDDDAATRTLPSPATTLVVSASTLCKFTLPPRPLGASYAEIYVAEGAGSYHLETTTTARSWTETTGGLVGTGAAPPSANNLYPLLPLRLVGGVEHRRDDFGRWEIKFTVELALA